MKAEGIYPSQWHLDTMSPKLWDKPEVVFPVRPSSDGVGNDADIGFPPEGFYRLFIEGVAGSKEVFRIQLVGVQYFDTFFYLGTPNDSKSD